MSIPQVQLAEHYNMAKLCPDYEVEVTKA